MRPSATVTFWRMLRIVARDSRAMAATSDFAAQDGGVGGFQCHVRSAAHGNADRSCREGGRIVDAVTHHGDRRCGLQCGHLSQLVVWQQFARTSTLRAVLIASAAL